MYNEPDPADPRGMERPKLPKRPGGYGNPPSGDRKPRQPSVHARNQ